MKRIRTESGAGNGNCIIPGGQILTISITPGADGSASGLVGLDGSWFKFNECRGIWVPSFTTVELGAKDLGLEDGENMCDRFPGDQQIALVFGQNATPGDFIPDGQGQAPLSWFVIYNG